MRRIICFLLAMVMLLSLVAVAVSATEVTEETTEATTEVVVRDPDQCGESMYWGYENGVLTITGSGVMDDFPEGAPWEDLSGEITKVVLAGDITYIGSHAFYNYDQLKEVDFGSALYEIGPEAFRSCDGLTVLTLPASFKIFGENSLMSCKNLTEIHCQGRFPSFRQNSLWDTYVTIYFSSENPWNPDTIRELEGAFQGRVEFLNEDGTDPVPPEEEETQPAETEPEETEPVETEPETTEQVTDATEGPMVIMPAPETSEETEPEITEPEEEADEEDEDDEKNGSWIGIVIIAAVAVIVIAGIITFRPKGKYTQGKRRNR